MSNASPFVSIHKAANKEEADLLRLVLEASGIQATVEEAEIRVPESVKDAAAKVLADKLPENSSAQEALNDLRASITDKAASAESVLDDLRGSVADKTAAAKSALDDLKKPFGGDNA